MSNIDKQAVTAKTKELASFMVERFSMNPVSCKLLNEAWEKEFPDEVAIAERMLALLDELEHYKSRVERVTKLVLDNSTSWDALYKKLEAAEKRIAELDKRLIEYAGIATREAHRVAELEARKVNLSKLSVGEVMHMSGFSRDYAEGWCAGNDNAIHEIRTAGIKVKES
ncbi:ead/Ea22-like family protein [Salmonella enterica subsp. enterica serovar Poona]|nr:ead/Ea22-like family protein [Salmonella enterica subsp. enterica serovar Poona]